MNRELWNKSGLIRAWFGNGDDDMRYFPVNRSGMDPVLKLPQPAELFPDKAVTLGGVDFKLCDPAGNDGKCCLVLDPMSEKTITIGSSFFRLWMLGALNKQVEKGTSVAVVTFYYSDGTEKVQLIKSGIHVSGYKSLEGVELGRSAWLGPGGKSPQVVLWNWPVKKPEPEKRVERINIKVDGLCSLALVGCTLEQ